jgi:xylulokinase
MSYIGLDVGTTGCKAMVVDTNGNILHHCYKEYNLIFPKTGWVEINAAEVWDGVCYVLSHIAKQSTSKLKAISIASFGEALVLLDNSDNILDNSIYYSDVRGTDEVEDILKHFDKQEIEEITGMPINPMYSLNKLLWIIKNKPDIYKQTDKIMLFGDYIAYRLSGERKIDYSLASRTMALDISSMSWSSKIFNAFSLDLDKFSQPVSSGSIIGLLHPSVCCNLGLPSDLLLIAGGHDQACAALGAGVIKAGDAVDGMGSSECITAAVNKPFLGEALYKNNYCCEPHLLKDTYITLAFNITAGAVTKWYRDTFENERHRISKINGSNIYQILDKECSISPSDIFLIPHFAGSGTPYMDSYASGALLGMKLNTRKSDIYKAILEGTCFEMLLNIELLSECGIETREITAVGGGAQSEILLQLKADIMNRPVKTLQASESGIMGLAILCATACGDYPDLITATNAMARIGNRFYPNNENSKRYVEKYEIYKQIYPALKTIFRK